jgi:proline-rich tail region repeat protein
MSVERNLAVTLLAGLVFLLGGCAATRMIDSNVQSFTATVPAVRPALYRFERLPSQGDSGAQDQIEALATQALAKVGLTPAPQVSGAIAGTAAAAPSARYAVQVSLQITTMVSPYVQGSYAGGFWGRSVWGHGGGLGLVMEPSWYRHAVRIVMRDSASGQLAYETTASFDGPWADSGNLLPVILDAALNGYPTPPAGPRKVIIELPGKQPAAP